MKFLKKIKILFWATTILFSCSVNCLWGNVCPEGLAETGEKIIKVGDCRFSFTSTEDRAEVFGQNNELVFEISSKNENSVLSKPDYCVWLDSFFVFRQTFNPEDLRYSLFIDTGKDEIELCENSSTPFYSPILVEDNRKIKVLFVTESFSIRILNIMTGRIEKDIKFDVPVCNLAKNALDNSISFFKFSRGRYVKIILFSGSVSERGKSENLSVRKNVEKETIRERHLPEISLVPADLEVTLYYRKIIGFGDSITFGKINKQDAPERGYIPRLQNLFDSEFFGIQVVNEGIGATVTSQAVERLEAVILNHRGKYLLMHYGTNDIVHPGSVPVSLVVFNIGYMAEMLQRYSVQSVLSTLIPRNPDYIFGSGLYRQRALEINKGITGIAQKKDLPLIDFWQIFSNYPAADGGYAALMSDNVHPSEQGYQLMANLWLNTLKALLPEKPANIRSSRISFNKITVNWSENHEWDFDCYDIEFGFSSFMLNRLMSTSDNNAAFINLFLQPPFNSSLFFRIRSVDVYGNKSSFSDVMEFRFR